MKIDIAPEALADLENIKKHLDKEFGITKEKEILKAIFKDIKTLAKYPNMEIKLFERFDIITDYKCFCSHRNYIFYRVEDDYLRVIRVLDEKRDFINVLFGTTMRSKESEDYWGE